MKNRLRLTNLTIGIIVVILFAITGQLMRHYYHNAEAGDVERLYRRSRHLLLLLSGLMQGGIGVYIHAHQHKLSNTLQWVATALMTLGSLGLIYAFFNEIPQEILKTPISRLAMYILLASAVLHLGSSVLNNYVQSKTKQ
jgi:O-antigen/teichoic acid export membrane protein